MKILAQGNGLALVRLDNQNETIMAVDNYGSGTMNVEESELRYRIHEVGAQYYRTRMFGRPANPRLTRGPCVAICYIEDAPVMSNEFGDVCP